MNKSKAATFFLSFVPGLGHFHLGLMNRGLQLMIAFFGSAFLFNLLDFDFPPFFMPILWFYGLFDALQQHQRIRERGEVEDRPFVPWNLSEARSSAGRWAGWILIFAGALLLVDRILPQLIGWEHYQTVRTALVALLLIYIGYRMLTGKSLFPAKPREKEHRP